VSYIYEGHTALNLYALLDPWFWPKSGV